MKSIIISIIQILFLVSPVSASEPTILLRFILKVDLFFKISHVK